MELYYRRSETVHKGRVIPARIETVVIFLPDVRSCIPTLIEWDGIQNLYKNAFENIRIENSKIDSAAESTSLTSSSKAENDPDSTTKSSLSSTSSAPNPTLLQPNKGNTDKIDSKKLEESKSSGGGAVVGGATDDAAPKTESVAGDTEDETGSSAIDKALQILIIFLDFKKYF